MTWPRRLAPLAVLAAAWALLVAYAWPGQMTWDSVTQLFQARTGSYGDWHPPLMARLWAGLDALVPGPALMLVLQTGLFALGLHAVLRRYAGPWGAAVLAAAVLLFPPVFAPLTTIWKDSLLAAVLLCAAAGLDARPRIARAAAWLGLVVVAALRHNAPILIVPLTAMMIPWAASWPAWRRRALGAGLGLAAALAGLVISRGLARTAEYPFANMIAIRDLGAVIAGAPAMSDGEARALLDGVELVGDHDLQARLRALVVDDSDFYPLSQGDHRVFVPATTPAQAEALVRAWRRAIAAYPAAYLAARARLLAGVLGWTASRGAPLVTPLTENAHQLALIGEHRSYTEPQRAVARAMRRISHSAMFWPTLYLVLALGLLPLLWRDPLQRGLLVGALAYELALLFVSTGSNDYRYSHWLITCAVIASAVRVLGAVRAARSGETGTQPPTSPDSQS